MSSCHRPKRVPCNPQFTFYGVHFEALVLWPKSYDFDSDNFLLVLKLNHIPGIYLHLNLHLTQHVQRVPLGYVENISLSPAGRHIRSIQVHSIRTVQSSREEQGFLERNWVWWAHHTEGEGMYLNIFVRVRQPELPVVWTGWHHWEDVKYQYFIYY